MMLLKVFNFFVVAGLAVITQQQAYAGIPVYCYNCQEASYNVGHSVLDAIRNQTDALLNGLNYATKADASVGVVTDVQVLKAERVIENTKDWEPTLAKPNTACTTYKAAALRNAVSKSHMGKTKQMLLDVIRTHNKSASQLSDTEPKREYFVGKILDKLAPENKKDLLSSGDAITAEPFSASELPKKLEEIAFLTNPLPLESPSVEALREIKKGGSTGDKDSMARMLVSNDRLERAQAILASERLKDARLFDSSSLNYYANQVRRTLDPEQKAAMSGKLSARQIDELTATYRVKSSLWASSTMGLTSLGVAKEQALTQAEILNQLWKINDTLSTMLRMQAWADAQNVNQKGPTKQ